MLQLTPTRIPAIRPSRTLSRMQDTLVRDGLLSGSSVAPGVGAA
jgi:hypothetical protein